VWLHYLLTSALDGGDCLGSGTGRLTLGRHQSPLNGRLRGLQSLPGLPGEEEYFLFLPGLEPRTVQAVTQLCYNNTCTSSRLIVSRPSRHLVACGAIIANTTRQNCSYILARWNVLQNLKENKMGGARSTDGERKRAIRVVVTKSEGKRPKT